MTRSKIVGLYGFLVGLKSVRQGRSYGVAMQEILITVLPTVVVILFSSVLTVFLLKTWYSQEARLLTDLPLVFSLMFTGLSAVMGLQL